MKKKLPLLIISVFAVTAISAAAVIFTSQNNVSSLLMSNIEALASGEGGSGGCVPASGTCTHNVNGDTVTESGMSLE